MEDYAIIRSVGKGSYGKVYLARHLREAGKQYVLKVIKLRGIPAKEREACRNEVMLMQRLAHPSIVAFKDSFFVNQRESLCIVMTYCDGGDLSARIAAQNGTLLKENQVMHWFVQVALAIGYMHDKNVLHRDIKTQNVFLLGNGRLVLGDLGISKVLGDASATNKAAFARTQIGTPYYMSPEIYGNRPYDAKSDVWALGCVLYELCAAGRHPFDAASLPSLAQKVMKGTYPPLNSKYSTALRQLVASMLSVNPLTRPSINTILKQPYVVKHIYNFIVDLGERAALSTIHTSQDGTAAAPIGDGTIAFRAAFGKAAAAGKLGGRTDANGNSVSSATSFDGTVAASLLARATADGLGPHVDSLYQQLISLGLQQTVLKALQQAGAIPATITTPQLPSPALPAAVRNVATPITVPETSSPELSHAAAKKLLKDRQAALEREEERQRVVEHAIAQLKREKELRAHQRDALKRKQARIQAERQVQVPQQQQLRPTRTPNSQLNGGKAFPVNPTVIPSLPAAAAGKGNAAPVNIIPIGQHFAPSPIAGGVKLHSRPVSSQAKRPATAAASRATPSLMGGQRHVASEVSVGPARKAGLRAAAASPSIAHSMNTAAVARGKSVSEQERKHVAELAWDVASATPPTLPVLPSRADATTEAAVAAGGIVPTVAFEAPLHGNVLATTPSGMNRPAVSPIANPSSPVLRRLHSLPAVAAGDNGVITTPSANHRGVGGIRTTRGNVVSNGASASSVGARSPAMNEIPSCASPAQNGAGGFRPRLQSVDEAPSVSVSSLASAPRSGSTPQLRARSPVQSPGILAALPSRSTAIIPHPRPLVKHSSAAALLSQLRAAAPTPKAKKDVQQSPIASYSNTGVNVDTSNNASDAGQSKRSVTNNESGITDPATTNPYFNIAQTTQRVVQPLVGLSQRPDSQFTLGMATGIICMEKDLLPIEEAFEAMPSSGRAESVETEPSARAAVDAPDIIAVHDGSPRGVETYSDATDIVIPISKGGDVMNDGATRRKDGNKPEMSAPIQTEEVANELENDISFEMSYSLSDFIEGELPDSSDSEDNDVLHSVVSVEANNMQKVSSLETEWNEPPVPVHIPTTKSTTSTNPVRQPSDLEMKGNRVNVSGHIISGIASGHDKPKEYRKGTGIALDDGEADDEDIRAQEAALQAELARSSMHLHELRSTVLAAQSAAARAGIAIKPRNVRGIRRVPQKTPIHSAIHSDTTNATAADGNMQQGDERPIRPSATTTAFGPTSAEAGATGSITTTMSSSNAPIRRAVLAPSAAARAAAGGYIAGSARHPLMSVNSSQSLRPMGSMATLIATPSVSNIREELQSQQHDSITSVAPSSIPLAEDTSIHTQSSFVTQSNEIRTSTDELDNDTYDDDDYENDDENEDDVTNIEDFHFFNSQRAIPATVSLSIPTNTTNASFGFTIASGITELSNEDLLECDGKSSANTTATTKTATSVIATAASETTSPPHPHCNDADQENHHRDRTDDISSNHDHNRNNTSDCSRIDGAGNIQITNDGEGSDKGYLRNSSSTSKEIDADDSGTDDDHRNITGAFGNAAGDEYEEVDDGNWDSTLSSNE